MKFLDRNPPQFEPDEAGQLALAHYGLEGPLTPLTSERDQNFRIRATQGDFVLKIANAAEDPGVLDFQAQALQHIAHQDPELPVPRLVRTVNGNLLATVNHSDGTPYLLYALTYLPGSPLDSVSQEPALWRQLGRFTARLDTALRSFFHPRARHELLWDIMRCAGLRPYTHHIGDATARSQIEAIFDRFVADIQPRLSRLRHQVIHADAHGENVLAQAGPPARIAGLVDFGDMVYAPLIIEVAIAADLESASPAQMLDKLCAVTAGYDTLLALEADEIDLIYDLILTRLAVTATIVAWRKAMTPDQPAYLVASEPNYWATLAHLHEWSRARVCRQLRQACRFPYDIPCRPAPEDSDETTALLDRRTAVLGQHLSYFYSRPLHVERGRGVWLYTTDGERYLDAYNNVPVVGHSHPHVVRAVSRQLGVLNTNTRYLYRNILDYAERLVNLLADNITVCAFVNSGSEANDIAWRIARFTSGEEGALVIDNAYHGITNAVINLSPEELPHGPPRHIKTLLAPDPYGGRYRAGETDLARKYAADADRALAELDADGLGPAAFMIDTLLVSSGTPSVLPGYVNTVADKVQAAGGLFIADEVQAGFGRSGEHMWGYQLHDAVPDIVTMGKPVANGFPMGVIATSADVLNPFVAETGLFSTFGGNPAACAAGTAVVDVLENEGLLANARETGAYLRAGIRQLMPRHPLIGDVRGRGLLVAVALVRDRDTREPAPTEATRLLDLMREHHVLIGRGGPQRNVLKIRPPLIFQRHHADILIEALNSALTRLQLSYRTGTST